MVIRIMKERITSYFLSGGKV